MKSRAVALEGHDGGFDVRLANGDLLRPEAVVLASPGPATAGLLDKIAPAAAAHVRSIAHGSTAVVSLGYRLDQFPKPPTGHGFLVAEGEPLAVDACTISSLKWARAGARRDRPPARLRRIAFIGGAGWLGCRSRRAGWAGPRPGDGGPRRSDPGPSGALDWPDAQLHGWTPRAGRRRERGARRAAQSRHCRGCLPRCWRARLRRPGPGSCRPRRRGSLARTAWSGGSWRGCPRVASRPADRSGARAASCYVTGTP